MTQISDYPEADQDPPRISVKFANSVFTLGVLVSIYAAYKLYIPIHGIDLGDQQIQDIRLIFIFTGLLSATLFGIGLRLRNSLKVNLSVMIFTIVLSLYAFETCLDFLSKVQKVKTELSPPQQIAKQMGIPYDERTKFEVLDDLRKDGNDAYPNIHPSVLLNDPLTRSGLQVKNGNIFPIGGISGKTMVQNNENGYWMMYEGDSYGFHNPKRSYQNGVVDIVITGDSFAEGWSVKSNQNINAVLRESDFNVINLGKSGNGPILEYAALKEYAESVKPKIVLWLYYPNDHEDLQKEMKSSLLMRYFNENDFSQNLMARQDEINNALTKYAKHKEEYEREKEKEIKRAQEQTLNYKTGNVYWLIKRSLKLKNFELARIRKRLNFPPLMAPLPMLNFKKILKKSRRLVSKWNAKLYFVYLPEYFNYSPSSYGKEDIFREYVLRTVIGLKIPVIDIHSEVFISHPDPLSLFPFRRRSHYNADGYRLVAEAITKRLKEDGF